MYIYIYIYPCGWPTAGSSVASLQCHCCVTRWQCRVRTLTLPLTRLDPPVGHQSSTCPQQATTCSWEDSQCYPRASTKLIVAGSVGPGTLLTYKGLVQDMLLVKHSL